VLVAMLICLAVGAVLLIPSLAWLYVLFQRGGPDPAGPGSGPGGAVAAGRG
jgi:cytochrome bd ubiquinol oxidase subunit II